MQIAIFLVIAVILLAILAARNLLRVERFRLENLDKYSEKFSGVMRRILSADVEWTDDMLAQIGRWNGYASKKELVLPIWIALSSLKKERYGNQQIFVDKPREEFFARNPGLEADYVMMAFYALLTACHSKFWIWPKMLENYIKLMERNPKEAVRFTEVAQTKIGFSKPQAVLPAR